MYIHNGFIVEGIAQLLLVLKTFADLNEVFRITYGKSQNEGWFFLTFLWGYIYPLPNFFRPEGRDALLPKSQ